MRPPDPAARVVGVIGEELADGLVGEIAVPSPGGPVRTGELGYRSGGVLHVLGRRKDLVIRGPRWVEEAA